MRIDDLNPPDNRSSSGLTDGSIAGGSASNGSTLGERLHRNLHGLIVATVLTLAAVAVLVSHYAL